MVLLQEAFESKQASMFVAIDKLFALHSAMLFESRVIIAFLVYSVAIFIVYMLTSIKQAYNVRHRLYLGKDLNFAKDESFYHTHLHNTTKKLISSISFQTLNDLVFRTKYSFLGLIKRYLNYFF